ncbi:MAG TPA: DoxX family protein [Candidatus Binatia bacterium]
MQTVGRLAADPGFLVFARFAVVAFFAIVFLQSGLNKVFDSEGNLSFLREHFKEAPTLANNVNNLFWALTILELLAGVFCGLALITFSFTTAGFFARWGIRFATLALLALLFGQRLAKDYAGAAVVAAYFAVALLGLIVFAVR